jgi:hypothetical protein
MFKITGGKGFHIRFENGYTVSVQFGPGNYCDHYDARIGYEEAKCGQEGSLLAECAVWGPESKRELIKHELFEGDTVGGYMSPSKVLELLNWAARQ